jgi:hypothetical protein
MSKLIKICKTHNCEKEYRERFVKGQIRREYICKQCAIEYKTNYRQVNKEEIAIYQKEYNKNYYQENKEEIDNYNKNYYQENKEEISKYKKEYKQENKEQIDEYQKEWYQENKKEILEQRKNYYYENKEEILLYAKKYRNENKEYCIEYGRKYQKNRRENDPAFKLHSIISHATNTALKKNGSTKGGKSVKWYLSYSFQALQTHLENQFAWWMTWQNWGKYDPQIWDDDNVNTWTWNIDHIIPQSELPYTSMQDENFKKCWALENLRPLSAKQNILDGVSRIRHSK